MKSRRGSLRFLTPSLYDLFRNSVERKMRRMAQWTGRARRRRLLELEALEPRMLLSADLSYTATAAADLTLRVADVGGIDTLQLVDTADPSVVLAGQAVSGIDGTSGYGARIDSTGVDVTLRLDQSVMAAQVAGGILFVGGTGVDTLVGAAQSVTWNITGAGEGDVGQLHFVGVENLTGAADNQDEFVLTGAASISGLIHGGDRGFDTLVLSGGSFASVAYTATGPDSGTIARDADLLRYAGLEPIEDNLDTVNRTIVTSDLPDSAKLTDLGSQLKLESVSLIPTFESVTFSKPTNSLTIGLGGSTLPFIEDSLEIGPLELGAAVIINGQAGDDRVVISGNVNLFNSPLSISAEEIQVDPGVAISAGDITFEATSSTSLTWSPGIVGFRVALATATIDLGEGSVLAARDVILRTSASTTKLVDLDIDLAPDTSDELKQLIDESDLVEFDVFGAAVYSESSSAITLHRGAAIQATRDVELDADAFSHASIITKGRFLGVTYASSSPTAQVTVNSGVEIIAGRDVDVTVDAQNVLDVVTVVPTLGDLANVSLSYGKARTKGSVDIAVGSSIAAENVTISTQNTNAFSNIALAAGFDPGATAGIGATGVLSSFASDAEANVGGSIAAASVLSITAESVNLENVSRATAAVLNPAGANPQVDEIESFLESLSLTREVAGQTIDPNGPGPDLGFAGAVVIARSSNTANASIGDGARAAALDGVIVNAVAEDSFKMSATATAGDAALASVGGAVAVGDASNEATALIGDSAAVDSAHAVEITASASIPNQVPSFDPLLDLNDVDAENGAESVTEEYDDGQAVKEAVAAAFAPFDAYLEAVLGDEDQIGTTFVHAGGSAPGGSSPSAADIAGGVVILDVSNVATAAVSADAKINQGITGILPAALDQDVIVHSESVVGTVHLGGQESALNFPSGAGAAAAVGGYYSGIFIENQSAASIGDGAVVSAGRDVVVSAQTLTDVLSALENGSESNTVGIQGTVGFVEVHSGAAATVEDQAVVNAGRHITVGAAGVVEVVNLTGGVASGDTVGAGASASLTKVEHDVLAQIGDADGFVEPGAAGSVNAGGNVSVQALALTDAISLSVSGIASQGQFERTGGVEDFQVLEFGFGVSGDVALNDVRATTHAEIENQDVDAAGAIVINATDATQLAAAAGAIVSANHLGIGGAFGSNELERDTVARTRNANLQIASLTVTAESTDDILTLSGGGSGAVASAAVAGSASVTSTSTLTEASLGQGTDVNATGAVVIDADATHALMSVAGAEASNVDGFFSAAATLDKMSIDAGARAFIAEEASVTAGADIQVTSNLEDHITSISAAIGESDEEGEHIRVYRNDGTGDPFDSISGEDVGDDDQLTTAVALADIDDDGDLDLIQGNFSTFNQMFMNEGGVFDEGKALGRNPLTLITEREGGPVRISPLLPEIDAPSADQLVNLTVPDLTLALATGDVNNDGYVDVIAGNFGQPSRLHFNRGEGLLPVFQPAINPIVNPAIPGGVPIPLASFDPEEFFGPFDLGKNINGFGDLTTSIALGDVDGDGDLDLVMGNFGAPNMLYENDGSGNFTVSRPITTDADMTMAVALGDVTGDGRPDLVVGNVGLDPLAFIEEGLLGIDQLKENAIVSLQALIDAQIASLSELISKGILDRLDIDISETLNIDELVTSGVTTLGKLIRRGLLTVEDFAGSVTVPPSPIVASGLVESLAALIGAGLTNGTTEVDLEALIQSGLVRLDQLADTALITLDDVATSTLEIVDIIDAGAASLLQLARAGLVDATDFLTQQLNVRELVEKGAASLRELAEQELLDATGLDLSGLSPTQLARGFTFGSANKLYVNNGQGVFLPGIEITSGTGITLAVAIADVDGVNGDDILFGNFGGTNRLYRNNGAGGFTGEDLTSDIGLTTSLAVGDIDGDDDLDVVVGRFHQTNRLLTNDGTGHFTAANIGVDENFTTSVAVGDLDGDGKLEVVAGNARPSLALAGSAGFVEASDDVQAFLDDGSSASTPGTLRVEAGLQTDIVAAAGAAASATLASLGLSVVSTDLTRNVEAYIGAADVSALGNGPGSPAGVLVFASTEESVITAAYGETSADITLTASALYNRENSSTDASIRDDAQVNVGAIGASAQRIEIIAEGTSDRFSFAGFDSAADRAGVGAAAAVDLMERQVSARVGDDAELHAVDGIVVRANTVDRVDTLVVGTILPEFDLSPDVATVAIAGSLSFTYLDTATRAWVGNSLLDTNGNVLVLAEGDSGIDSLAGRGSLALVAGLGFSASVVLESSEVTALIAQGADIRARGRSSATSVEVRDLDGSETRDAQGLIVSAISDVELDLMSVGGGLTALLSGVGSLNFSGLEQITEAIIGSDAKVNVLPAGDVGASADSGILVHAFSDTDVFGLAGALSLAVGAGFGAGLDISAIGKETQATAGGELQANRNLEVLSRSREKLQSVAATLELAAAATLGGAIAIYSLAGTTRASIAPGSVVRARGNVLVSADSDTETDIVTGALSASVLATGGAAASVVIVDKTTEAFIGEDSDVVANAQGDGIEAATGEYELLPPQGLLNDLIDELLELESYQFLQTALGLVANNPISDAIEDVVGGDLYGLLISPADLPPLDLTLLNSRRTMPLTQLVHGVAVTATNRDDVETLSVGLGLTFVLPFASASFSTGILVTSNDTRAFVDNGASVNAGLGDGSLVPTGTPALPNQVGLEQDVHLIAASDTSVVHLSGALTKGGSGLPGGGAENVEVGGLGPAINLSMSKNRTEAFIGEGAEVRSADDVNVFAFSQEKLAGFAAGFATTAGGKLDTINDTLFILDGEEPSSALTAAASLNIGILSGATWAFIADGAVVDANGNVFIEARANTDVDVIAGAGILATGAFSSVPVDPAGIGAAGSGGFIMITKDTRAWIGDATVDAHAHGDPVSVFSGEVNGHVLQRELKSGIAVQARSDEDVFSLDVSGGKVESIFPYAETNRIAGAGNFFLLNSDTLAFVDEGAEINQNTNETNADASQSVSIGAGNRGRIYGMAVSAMTSEFGLALAGAGDIGVVSNDTTALIRSGALVSALDTIDVNSVSSIETDSLVGSFGNGLRVKFAASTSLYFIRQPFEVSFFELAKSTLGFDGVEAEDLLGIENLASGLQSEIDADVFAYTDRLGGQLGSTLARIGDFLIGGGQAQDAIEANAPELGTASNAINGVIAETNPFGEPVVFNPLASGAIDHDDATLDLGNHDFKTGDAITYSSGTGNPIIGLLDGSVYFISVDQADPTLVRFHQSRGDAVAGINPIPIGVAGDPIRGLVDNGNYFVNVDSDGRASLHLTQADAMAGTNAIELDTRTATGKQHALNTPIGTFNIKLASHVSGNRIQLNDDVNTGDAVTYRTPKASGSAHTLTPRPFGTQAIVDGATLHALTVTIDAEESVDVAADTSWTLSGGLGIDPLNLPEATSTIPSAAVDAIQTAIGGTAVAGITGNAIVTAEHVRVDGRVESIQQLKSLNAVGKSVNTAQAFIVDSTVTATTGDVIVEATNDAKMLFASIIPYRNLLASPFFWLPNVQVSDVEMVNSTDAFISDSAVVQAEGSVFVRAQEIGQSVSLADTVSIRQDIAGNAVTIGMNNSASSVRARILGSEVVALTGDIEVSALSDVELLAFSVGIAVDDTNFINIAGSLVVNITANTIQASLENSEVTAAGDVLVHAHNDNTIGGFAGGAARASNLSVGAAAGINEINDVVRAFVIGGNVTALAGEIEILAEATPNITMATFGYAQASDRPQTSEKAKGVMGILRKGGSLLEAGIRKLPFGDKIVNKVGELGPGSYPIGGSASFNSFNSTIEAFVTGDAELVAEDGIQVHAQNDPTIVAIAGAGALNFRNQGLVQTAIGAALSFNSMNDIVVARVGDNAGGRFDPTTAVSGNSIQLGAHGLRTGDAVVYDSGLDNSVPAISIGGLEDGKVYFVSVVAGNPSRIRLHASREDALAGINAITLDAADASGQAHILSLGTLDADAIVGGPRLEAPAISVLATTNADIVAITLGGAGADDFAFGGSFSQNDLGQRLQARAGNGAELVAGTFAEVRADDDSHIFAGSGAYGDAQFGSIGAAISANTIHIGVQALAERSTILAPTVSILARTDGNIEAVTLGGAGAETFAIAGSYSDNEIDNIVEARLSGGGVVAATTRLDVHADDDSGIFALSGGAAGAQSFAVGAAISNNDLRSNVTALIDAATATAPEINVLTTTNSDIVAISAGGTGAQSFALGGSISLNEIQNELSSSVSGQAVVVAGASLNIEAHDDANIVAIGANGTGAVGAAVGASISTNELSSTVRAFIHNASPIAPSINILATTESDIDAITAAGTGAEGFAAGGAVSLNEISNTVDAHISGGAVVSPTNVLNIHAHDDTIIVAVSISGQGAAGGAFGLAAATNDVGSSVMAFIEDATASAPAIDISASTNADIDAITVGGVGSGGFTVAGSISLNEIGNTVDAHISSESIVTATGVVNVKAHDDTLIVAVAGNGAGSGGGAVGAALATNDIFGSITAYVEDSKATAPTINVHATTDADITAVTVAGTGAGGFALGGSISLNEISNALDAHISADAEILATAAVQLRAHDESNIGAFAGSGAGAGGAAIGAALTTNDIASTVLAYIDGASVDAASVGIEASTDSDIDTIAVGGAGAGGFALGGSVSVEEISNTVDARISGGAEIETSGNITILAADNSDIDGFGGGFAGAGGAGIGAGLSTDRITSDVSAAIAGSEVHSTAGNIVVSSKVDAIMETLAMGGAGAEGFALGGSISNATASTSNTATISGGADVSAAGSVSVLALSTLDMDADAGAGAIGSAGIAAAIIDVDINPDTTASIMNATVNAGNLVEVSAVSDLKSADIDAFAGTGGAFAGQAVVANEDSANDATAFIGGTTVIGRAGSVVVAAEGTSNIDVQGLDLGIGGVAIGVMVVNASERGLIRAFIGDGVTIGGATAAASNVGNVSVTADSTQSVVADEAAAGGGIVDISVNFAKAEYTGDMEAYIGDANVAVTGNVLVGAHSNNSASSDGFGFQGSAVGAGVVRASAEVGGTQEAYLAGATVLAGNDISLINEANGSASSDVTALSGGVFGAINVNLANAEVSPVLTTSIGANTTVNAARDVIVRGQSFADATAETLGVTVGGGLAFGLSEATASLNSTVDSFIGSTVTAGRNISVKAFHNTNENGESGNTAEATAHASGGSLGAAATGATADASSTATVRAHAGGSGVTLTATNGKTEVLAGNNNDAVAVGDGVAIGGAAGIGIVNAITSGSGTTEAFIESSTKVLGGGLDVLATAGDFADADATAAAGGILFSGTGSEGTADTNPSVSAEIRASAVVDVSGSVRIHALSTTEADAASNGVSLAGGVSGGSSTANVNEESTVTASLGTGASITTDASVEIKAQHNEEVEFFDGTFTANSTTVNTNLDRITLPGVHGLSTGDRVTYSNGGGVSIGGLINDQTYAVIVISPTVVQLGQLFNPSGVDASLDIIRFNGAHNLVTGQRVIYGNGGNANITGLVGGNAYFVRVIDPVTIKLYNSAAEANAADKTFTAADVIDLLDVNLITIAGHGFIQNQAVSYFAPPSEQFFGAAVEPLTNDNTITFENHGFASGNRVSYRAEGIVVGGLVNGGSYYVLKIDDNTLKLATNPLNLVGSVVNITNPGDDTSHYLSHFQELPLTGLVDGKTYYIDKVNDDTIRLLD
ncbi:MAG TPA: VCBS repeat-containing protein, partial [Terriglobia bacterium]|nr:VCBS repeat-containing protein [Terriglobia bacterium]